MGMIEDWKDQPRRSFDRQENFLEKLKKKRGHELDETAEKIHNKVFKKIDCLDCANCCTSIPPIVKKQDSLRISKYLGLPESEFFAKYLRVDEDGDIVMNQSPCPFLGDQNYCEIYEVRPKACETYPHTNQYQFSSNLKLHKFNNQYCPAVFHIIERLQSLDLY